jgi:bifunctional non-homologous end joining protein LigD
MNHSHSLICGWFLLVRVLSILIQSTSILNQENIMNALAKTSLYYSEGRSDKEYHAEIVEVAGGNVVNFRYGRRGGSLTVGTKTSAPVDFAQAKKIYDKLVKEKTAKGYTPDVSGTAYQGTENAGIKTDFMPQLLNAITEQEAMAFITDANWAAQEKMDGERRAAHAENGYVIGINRKCLIVPLPQAIADELQAIDDQSGAIRVDGEIIGGILFVFDLHIHKGEHIHALPWVERMRRAESILAGCKHIKTVPVATTTAAKRELWNTVKTAHGEGVVFKQLNCPVTKGRPNTGGDWLKFKFTESASCCVMEVNVGKRSVKIGLLDATGHPVVKQGQMMMPVGNVTIPPNHEVPAAGDIVEVEYLYAYKGGSIYQPVYRGKRMDLDMTACTTAQLKYKPEGREEEDES